MTNFWIWICDTFGHEKSGIRNCEWIDAEHRHYQCVRCRRVVTTTLKPSRKIVVKAVSDDSATSIAESESVNPEGRSLGFKMVISGSDEQSTKKRHE